MNKNLSLLTITAAAILAGCGSVSGLDAGSTFACAAPDGVTCMSVSGIYANAKANNLPGLRSADGSNVKMGDSSASGSSRGATASREPVRNYGAPTQTYGIVGTTEKTSPKTMTAPNSGMPLRTPERIVRVWLAPFEDVEGDLHDQKYFYVTVNAGSWTIEANKVNIKNRFQQVRPLSKNNGANAAEASPAATPQQQAMQTLPSAVQQQQVPVQMHETIDE